MSRYDRRGVSATKDEVHKAIEKLDKGLFPNAFCKVLPDVLAGDEAFCNIMHADTAGTKTSLAYLYWRETGDINVWKGISQDAIVMNLDDMACVGAWQNVLLSSTIGRNKNIIPGEVLSAVIEGTSEFIEKMAEQGIYIHLTGGETADVGDIVRTIDVGYTTFARIKRSELIVNDIKPGDVIVGFASYGKATYETDYNSGIGSNGLTSARHDVLNKHYAETYPDAFDPNTPKDVVFTGSKRMTDTFEGHEVGKLLLSPTRTYLPLLKAIFENTDRKKLHGIIHCSGGGQHKVEKFIHGVKVIKNNFFTVPPIFKLIQQESGTSNDEMYRVFNMGHRLEIYTTPDNAAQLIEIGRQCGIDAQIVGRVELAEKTEVFLEI